MFLTQAIEQLQDRKWVYRKAWKPEEGYLVFMPGMTHIWKIVTKPTANAGNYIFSFEDLVADDWELLDLSDPNREVNYEGNTIVN